MAEYGFPQGLFTAQGAKSPTDLNKVIGPDRQAYSKGLLIRGPLPVIDVGDRGISAVRLQGFTERTGQPVNESRGS